MSAVVTGPQASKSAEVVQTGPVSVYFRESVMFIEMRDSASVGLHVDSILPAKLEPDGSASVIKDNQRAEGLLLVRRALDRTTGKHRNHRCFVPFDNIKSVSYP